MKRTIQVALLSLLASACATPAAKAPAAGVATAKKAPQSPAATLAAAERAYESSNYSEAEAGFRAVSAGGPVAAAATLGLARVELITGRSELAVASARRARTLDPALDEAARCVAAEGLRRLGDLNAAKAELERLRERADAPRGRLALAELLLESGARKQAEPILLGLIDDYNSGRIDEKDGPGLGRAARAAWLLRSPRDANELFSAAERQSPEDTQLLLWRANLFLEKYDPGNAEQLVQQVLRRAPRQPEALTMLAQVRLDQALDLDQAERIARQALEVNPQLAAAHFVLGGISLRDMELAQADQRIDAGLKGMPTDLTLLSLRAVVRFLAEDEAGFDRAKKAVLQQNPEYSRLYAILGEYADWEHRYSEIVVLMREALQVDTEDAGAMAQLGFNLIRDGADQQGVASLSRAFSLDPFNVRVYNTLGLYETIIPKSYVSVRYPRFNVRYQKNDRALLERYVPPLLDRAFGAMQTRYGFSPEIPVGIELYAERQSFAVRTSGLPNTAIQGVCFGKTVAAMSPQNETFNLGMTLWHELSHVFHIQRSKSRVPRWFTEGLAEYETLVTRPEWSRQHDQDLFEMARAGKLPSVGRMSRAFTRAEALSDISTAYYASTQIVAMLAQRHGLPKIAEMLTLWGQGVPTAQVFERALRLNAEQVDQEFRAYLEQNLARYQKQFMPLGRARPVEVLDQELKRAPKDANLWVELAFARSRAQLEHAEEALDRALALDPKHPQARYLKARFLSEANDDDGAAKLLRGLLADGVEGYAIHFALGEMARSRRDTASARAAFELAHRLDPKESDPLRALAELAAEEKVPDDELEKLKLLAPLSAHDPTVHRRLLELLLQKKQFAEAVQAGEAALWADIDGRVTHVLWAEALAQTGDAKRAEFELESALLCPGSPKDQAEVHAKLAELLQRAGRRAEALRHERQARALDADALKARPK